MQFGNAHFLWLLVLIPLAAAFYVWAFRRRAQALERFAHGALLGQLVRTVSMRKKIIKATSIVFGVLFLILALSQPKWGYHWEEVKRRGIDIVVAIDVSKSMMAEDVKPNRLEGAKREIKSLIGMLKGDRIGIVAFAGSAFLQCPLTLDYGTAKTFVDHIDIESIPRGGTDIGGAIRTAVKAFEGHEKKYRVLILITDGEDHEAGVMDAVEEAKREGIVIFPVGVGRQEGAPIPVVDESGQKTFVKDEEGNVILSKLDPVLLQKIALMTGGKKGTIGAGSFPLEGIYAEVSKMEKKELESSRQKRYEHRFQWFLFAALLCFVFETLLTERKNVRQMGGVAV